MVGLDTNVLIRYLTQDDEHQAAKATAFIEGTLTQQNLGYINVIVLVETLWVLESCYTVNKTGLINVLKKLVTTKQFLIQNIEVVIQAILTYETHLIDYADALLGHINNFAQCSSTYTFDQKAAKLGLFTSL